jgi:HlyD family type I secretion membrane fusion protein
MAQLPSFTRRPPSDLITAPISAFESETQAVIQKAAPGNEQAIMHVLVGMIVLALALMSVVKLDRVVTGAGRVLPSQGSLFVQPLDRAIVTGILVRAGDEVKKGQVLATLDPTFALADLKDLQHKKDSAEALVARLRAEQAGQPYSIDPASPSSEIQASIWRQRQSEYQQSINDFDARIRSANSVVQRAHQDAEDYKKRLGVATELEKMQLTLQSQGFGSKLRTLAATDSRVEVERMMAESQNQTIQAQHDLSALGAQKSVYIGKWHDDIGTQLVQAQNDLNDATQGLVKASKIQDLSKLTAPMDAVVLNVGQVSLGSVIDPTTSSAQPLFTLVPLGGALEADVKVPARDIGFIRAGDTVRVKLDAYKFTVHGTADGVIKTISDGSFTTDDNNQPVAPYFKVRIHFTKVQLRNVPSNFHLIPGMTLEGDIMVGRRTMMSYLIEGALRTGSEAMREP